jgi:hypothetical protein
MSAMTTQLLPSGEFCELRYDTMPLKSASANETLPISQKSQILSCDTPVANERYALLGERTARTFTAHDGNVFL